MSNLWRARVGLFVLIAVKINGDRYCEFESCGGGLELVELRAL